MKIRHLIIKNNIFAAPMAGITDVGFRHLCKMQGAGLTFTEMVSAKGLVFGSKNTKNLLKTSNLEDVKAVQLFGSDSEMFAKALNLPELENFDIIDVNMGCPATKIIKNKEGSYLLKNFRECEIWNKQSKGELERISIAEQIIRACKANIKNRVLSVKFRVGFGETDNVAVEFAKMCERAGADFITLHARTTFMGYSGKANWQIIKDVKQAVKIPVVGNGDVVDYRTYKQMMDKTGVDAIMVARACFGYPKIFSDILNQKEPNPLTNEEILNYMDEYEKVMKESNIFNFNEYKAHFAEMLNNRPYCAKQKQAIYLAKDINECKEILGIQ